MKGKRNGKKWYNREMGLKKWVDRKGNGIGEKGRGRELKDRKWEIGEINE